MAEAAEEEDLGATKVLDETEAPAVTFAEGENEKLGEGVEEEDVADENELQRLIEAVREGDQARCCCTSHAALHAAHLLPGHAHTTHSALHTRT